MDGKTFDAITRRALAELPRRGMLRAGLAVLAAAGLSALGLDVVPVAGVATKKRRRRQREDRRKKTQRKKRRRQWRALNPPPPLPPPPTFPPPPPLPPPPSGVCPGQVECPPFGCCDQCCEPITGTPDLGKCAGRVGEDKCCSVADGGGYCDVEDLCCPPGVPGSPAPRGSCAPADATCCRVLGQDNGGWRNEDFPTCCAPDRGSYNCPAGFPVCCGPNDRADCCPSGNFCCAATDRGDCCPTDRVCCGATFSANCCPATSKCCKVDADCAAVLGMPHCVAGCCSATPSMTAASAPEHATSGAAGIKTEKPKGR